MVLLPWPGLGPVVRSEQWAFPSKGSNPHGSLSISFGGSRVSVCHSNSLRYNLEWLVDGEQIQEALLPVRD